MNSKQIHENVHKVIESFSLNFNLGNVVQSIILSTKGEDPYFDLKDALYYLQRELERVDRDYMGV
jgi:hypothetical protein